MLRAYDNTTGRESGEVHMSAPQSGFTHDVTYMLNGKEYVVVAISGGNYSRKLPVLRPPN